jgi:hypothetical protein
MFFKALPATLSILLDIRTLIGSGCPALMDGSRVQFHVAPSLFEGIAPILKIGKTNTA